MCHPDLIFWPPLLFGMWEYISMFQKWLESPQWLLAVSKPKVRMCVTPGVWRQLGGKNSEKPRGAGFRSVNPAERWRENPARALARAGFSQHLECGIHRSESSPEGSFAFIPHPVARWATTTPIQFVLPLATFNRSGTQRSNVYKRDVSVTSWRFHNRACPRHPGHCESTEGLWPISDAH